MRPDYPIRPAVRSLFAPLAVVALLLAGLVQASAAPVSFAQTDVNGKSHSLAAERGKWVVINVWATWCPPCRRELPELAAFARKHAHSDIRVWGLSVDQAKSAAELSMFAEDQKIGYPIFKVSPRQLQVFGGVRGIPTTFLVNPKGEVVAHHTGAITAKMLQKMIDRYR